MDESLSFVQNIVDEKFAITLSELIVPEQKNLSIVILFLHLTSHLFFITFIMSSVLFPPTVVVFCSLQHFETFLYK